MTAYVDDDDITAYLATRVTSGAWGTATTDSRTKAINHATRLIDRLNFKGLKTDSEQENEFPRDDETEVPNDIKYACIEIAIALLDGVDIEIEFQNLQMVAQTYGNIKSVYDKSSVPAHILAGIPSVVAWQYLLPYLYESRMVKIVRA